MNTEIWCVAALSRSAAGIVAVISVVNTNVDARGVPSHNTCDVAEKPVPERVTTVSRLPWDVVDGTSCPSPGTALVSGSTVRETAISTEPLLESVTSTKNENVSAMVGTPLSSPAPLRVNPGGSVLEEGTVHV